MTWKLSAEQGPATKPPTRSVVFARPGRPRVVHGAADEGGGSGGQAALARVMKGQHWAPS